MGPLLLSHLTVHNIEAANYAPCQDELISPRIGGFIPTKTDNADRKGSALTAVKKV